MRSPEPTRMGVGAICNPNAQDGESEQAGKPGQFKSQALDTARKWTSIYMVEITHKVTMFQPRDTLLPPPLPSIDLKYTHTQAPKKKKGFKYFCLLNQKKKYNTLN